MRIFLVREFICSKTKSRIFTDLFHKAIQESGSALNPWAMIKPEVLKGKSAVVAEMLGCASTESAALLECLQSLPAETLVNTTHKLLVSSKYKNGPWKLS